MPEVENKPAWNYEHEFSSTVPGGKICVGKGKYVNAKGESLDPADYKPRLMEAKAQIEKQLADLEAELAKDKPVAEEAKTPANFSGGKEGAE